MNTIRLQDIGMFCEVIAKLQSEGLRFAAYHEGDEFVIEITGH